MTTVAQIITDAYQINNLVALSVIPTAAEQAKALNYLNRIVKSVFGHEVGTSLTTYLIGSANVQQPDVWGSDPLLDPVYNIPPNSSVILNLTGAATVYLTRVPEDGALFSINDASNNLATFPLTIIGNGNKIEGATSLVVNSNSASIDWFYNASAANWARISNLALTDEFPFPAEFDEFFILMLALRLSASQRVAFPPELGAIMQKARTKFCSRYRQTVEKDSELGLQRLRTLIQRW